MWRDIGFWLLHSTVLVGTVLAFWLLTPIWFSESPVKRDNGTVSGEVLALQVGTYYQADDIKLDPHLIYDVINQARLERGLTPLVAHVDLAELAKQRSIDMSTKRYYAHADPDSGETFSDALRGDGFRYAVACENLNLVFHASAEKTVASWLASNDGHRECLLSPDTAYLGLAVSGLPTDNGQRAAIVTAIHTSGDISRE